MKTKALAVLIAFLFAAVSVLPAGAEEKFGVKVYPGSKFDAEVTKLVAQMGSGAACYRTADGVAKVAEFYRQQGLKSLSEDKESAMFTKGKVNITVQNPWVDMKTGKKNRDTLISIVKQ